PSSHGLVSGFRLDDSPQAVDRLVLVPAGDLGEYDPAAALEHCRYAETVADPHAVCAERGIAAALGAPQRFALDGDRGPGRRVVERRERGDDRGIVAAALHGERALRGRRHEAP